MSLYMTEYWLQDRERPKPSMCSHMVYKVYNVKPYTSTQVVLWTTNKWGKEERYVIILVKSKDLVFITYN